MALVVKDRVQETSTTTGTGTLTLNGAVLGFQTFAVIGNANQTYYAIADPATGDYEVGIGTYTASGTTLSRTTVLESSNSNSLVSFAAGVKNVFCTYPAERAVYLDTAGSAVTLLDIGTLGASTANISTANITSGTVATTPVNNTDIVNKAYADAIASGIHFHEAVALATTTALPANTYNNGTSGVGATLTGNANGALSVDSTLTIVAERILVKNEAAGANNGVYVVTQVGSAGAPYILTRATDFDTVGTGVDQIDEGDFFLVTSGTANVNTAWVQQTAPPITVGTTTILFQQFSAPITYTAGTGLSESPSYTFNIANTGTAGTYGGAASVPVFTTNAQGQVTSVTPTGIAIAAAAVSGLAPSATTDTTNASNITSGTLGTSRLSGSYTGVTGVGTLTAGTWNATPIGAVYGGTGQSSYAVGDLVYADTTTSLAKLADVAVGNALISGGVGSAPSYGKIGLATHVSGTLPIANGGTGSTSTQFVDLAANVTGTLPVGNGGTGAATFTANNVLLGNGTSAFQVVAPGTNGNVLQSNGTTWVSASAPSTMVYPGAGIPNSTGTSWATSYSTTGTGTVVALATSPSLTTPILGTPQSGNLANCTFPTLNQNTTGNAATATTLQTARTINLTSFNGSANITIPRIASIDDRTAAPADGSAGYATFGFGSWTNNNLAPYSDFFLMRSYSDVTGGNDNMVSFRKDVLGMRVWQQSFGSATAFSTFKDVAWTDGTNASGTWGINVTGNSATATTAINLSTNRTNWATNGTITAVVGQLAWKNYNNSHTIFDASAGTSPDGGAVNNTNSQIAWTATYPTLMGWNGANTYGVRVDSARIADSATTASNSTNLGGYAANTYIGKFGNVSGYYQADNWLQFNTSNGLYWPSTNAAELTANTTSTYGAISIIGVRNTWRGIHFNGGGSQPHLMFDGSSNGGIYYEGGGRWANYYNYGNNCTGFGTSSTNANYGIYVTKGGYFDGRVDATIFYDANNSSYYVDPSSVSVFSDIRINDGNVQLRSNNVPRNTKWRALEGTTDVGISFYNAQDVWCMQLYANAGNEYGFLRSNWSTWDLRKVPNGNLFMNDNNSYYLNITDTSNINKLYYNNNMVSQNYGVGQVGLYDSYRYQALFSMGESYILPANGTSTGNLYGMAWSHPNAGGIAGNLASHGFLILENGSFRGAWGGASLRNPGDIRGTIFYDYDNTGYYLDPTSIYSLRTVGDWRADSAGWTGEFAGKIQYHSNNWYLQFTSNVIFRNGGGTNVMVCDNGGNLTVTGSISGSTSYPARAWVNFFGQGYTSIRASSNVSSVSYNGTGNYTINFSTAMVDANYATIGSAWYPGAQQAVFNGNSGGTYATTAVQVFVVNSANGALLDSPIVNAAIFR